MSGTIVFTMKLSGGATGGVVNIRLLPAGTHPWENVLLSPTETAEDYLVDGTYDIQWIFTGPDQDAGITITITDKATGKPVRPPIVDNIKPGQTAQPGLSRFMIQSGATA